MLIFPRTKPLGANSANSRQAISDKAAFPTTVIDYLKIMIYAGGTQSKLAGASQGKGDLKETIYLYLPAQLQEQYKVRYNNVELGAVGNQAVNMAKDSLAAGGIGDGFGEQVKNMAAAAKPSLGYNMAASAISGIIGATGGSGNIDSNQLAALTTGQVFNPYEEMVFQGGEFRDHSFSFKLVPKNGTDVKTIYDIIQALRIAMLPGKNADTKWLTIPDKFRIGICRWKGGAQGESLTTPGEDGGYLKLLMRFPYDLVLYDMNINLSPDSVYTSLQTQVGDTQADFGPVSYELKLMFKETKYLTKENYI